MLNETILSTETRIKKYNLIGNACVISKNKDDKREKV